MAKLPQQQFIKKHPVGKLLSKSPLGQLQKAVVGKVKGKKKKSTALKKTSGVQVNSVEKKLRAQLKRTQAQLKVARGRARS